MSKIRIQKALSEAGILSRRKAEEYLKKGWIKVNGKTVTEMGVKVDPFLDHITLDPMAKKEKNKQVVLMVYKPRGIVTNLKQDDEIEIIDILPEKYKKLSAVGRLDKDSEGLILMTDDGVFANRALQEGHHPRTYIVDVDRNMTAGMLEKIRTGKITLFGEKLKSMKIRPVGNKSYEMVLREGKNRQIRRVMQKVGVNVLKLKRIRFGHLSLDLEPGKFRLLDTVEISAF